MSKSIVISERDNIAAVIENGKVSEFFIHRGDILLGDVYLASVENILPSIDAAFVNVGSDRMGFLHASDVTGKGALKDKLKPKQKLLVQVVKEPTGHKGPRVTTSLSLPGRFLVLMPDEKGVSISRKISSAKERARLKSIVSLLKPTGVGVIIRTEAEGQSEAEIQEDIEFLLEKWNNIVTTADTVTPPNLIHRDQDLLYRVIREACTEKVDEITLDTSFGYHRANQLLQSWNMDKDIKVSVHKGTDSLLVNKGIEREIRQALNIKVNMPSGGYLFIQQTEALTVIDINSGKFTSSATQDETIRKTNLEAVGEIARQLKLRNIGGMIIIDFIDMENRVDKLSVLEELEIALETDKCKPQIGQLSDLGLVELTRHRQGQSLSEIFTKKCKACSGTGALIEDFNFAASPHEGEMKAKASKVRLPHKNNNNRNRQNGNKDNRNGNKPMHHNKQEIKTMPSVAASVLDRKKPVESKENVKLDDGAIKEALSTEGHVPNISKVVRVTPSSPEVVNKNMPNDRNKDVFDVLQEMEKGEEATVEKPAKPQPRKTAPRTAGRAPARRRIEPKKVEAAVEQPPVVEPKQEAEPPKVEAPKVETSVEPDVEAPKRRGRKPKAEGTTAKKTTTRTRKSTAKAASTEDKKETDEK